MASSKLKMLTFNACPTQGNNMRNSIFGLLIDKIKYRFNLDEDKAAETEITENIRKGVEFRGINVWTLIFAIIIASVGLNVNSTAVIIGAMLISPLMGPIMGIGLGAGVFDFGLIKKAGKNLIIAASVSLTASTIYFFLSPLHNAQSELLARTSPTIWDVLIAFFGGLAGIVASSRTKYNNVIPGVAIATALMPPLCTAGFGLATMQWQYFFGAFYLFIINSVFISISTFLIVRFLKFSLAAHVDDRTSRTVKKWVGYIAVLTIIPSVYLAYIFVKHEIFEQSADQMINDEISLNGLTVINKHINADNDEIKVTILDYEKIDSVNNVLQIKKEKYGLTNAKIIVNSNRTTKTNEFSLDQVKQGIVEDLFVKQEALLNQKDDEIRKLRNETEARTNFEAKKSEAVDEFYSLYGKPKELIIEKTILHNDDDMDTVLLVFINPDRENFNREELGNMRKWLKAKFKMDSVRVIMQ